MDAMKLALIYVHLIACCVAIGAILASDVTMLVRILRRRGGEADESIDDLKRLVSGALFVLWATGLYFVWNDSVANGLAHTLSNPKLQAKIIVVTILTVNGLILHYGVLPLLARARSLLNLAVRHRALAILAGVLSGVSWMYAAFLGIARPLAWKYPLQELLLAYPLLVAAAAMGMWGVTAWAIRQAGAGSLGSLPFDGTIGDAHRLFTQRR